MPTRPMQVWNGTAWEDIGPQAPATAIVVQSSTPTGDSGRLWIDTSADVPTYANMAPTASPSFTGTSTFAGPVTMSGGAVSMSGATSVTGGGMDLITPTSVAGTGVTLSGGAVSFSASSTVSVNGCFTAAYDTYIVQCVALSSVAGSNMNIRMRSAGTDNSAANYDLQYGDVSGATANGGRSTGQTAWITAGALDTTYGLQTLTFAQPFLAASTVMTLFGGGPISSAYLRSSFNRHTASTSFDGFTMYPASGTTTGTFRIYGLRNS